MSKAGSEGIPGANCIGNLHAKAVVLNRQAPPMLITLAKPTVAIALRVRFADILPKATAGSDDDVVAVAHESISSPVAAVAARPRHHGLFGITTEWCSASDRNRARLDRIPHLRWTC
jgi:hypothetical protein